jgi:hypothetical protein
VNRPELTRHAKGHVLETALYAVTHHSGSEEHGERAARSLPDPDGALRVFRTLKDADGA